MNSIIGNPKVSNVKIQKALNLMKLSKGDNKKKGEAGELVGLEIVQKYKAKHGGVIYTNLKYPYVKGVEGNVHYIDNTFQVLSSSSYNDEIDILYITDNKLIVIEVKARVGTWSINSNPCWFREGSLEKGNLTAKCAVSQCEKHCRQLYHTLYEVLPKGNPSYIKGVVLFVEQAVIVDARDSNDKKYLPISIANNLISVLKKVDIPDEFKLDIDSISKQINKIKKEGTRY